MNVKEFDELNQKVKTENARWFGLESKSIQGIVVCTRSEIIS